MEEEERDEQRERGRRGIGGVDEDRSCAEPLACARERFLGAYGVCSRDVRARPRERHCIGVDHRHQHRTSRHELGVPVPIDDRDGVAPDIALVRGLIEARGNGRCALRGGERAERAVQAKECVVAEDDGRARERISGCGGRSYAVASGRATALCHCRHSENTHHQGAKGDHQYSSKLPHCTRRKRETIVEPTSIMREKWRLRYMITLIRHAGAISAPGSW